MLANNTYTQEQALTFKDKVAAYVAFSKLRLSILVVFSAAVTYAMAAGYDFSWVRFSFLILGGFLITASSNGFNQILERDLDALMSRTQSRPLVKGTMSVTEAVILATLMGVGGAVILWTQLNWLSGLLGVFALLSYVAVYTPMKRKSPFAVFIGAFPGAVPAMLGWIAHTGVFGAEPGALFAMQFMWQFPHFWAIAWKLDDDYRKAGFLMLPSKEGRNMNSAYQILLYTLFMIPVSLVVVLFEMTSIWAGALILLAGLPLLKSAYQLYRTLEMKYATKLMFGSFLYLPVVLLIMMLDKYLTLWLM